MRNFVETARDSGWSVSGAMVLLSDARRFGQAAWANPEDGGAVEDLGLLRSLREEILAAARKEEPERRLSSFLSFLAAAEGSGGRG